MQKKALIIFNGVEKIFDITEDFHTKHRILDEMAQIWSEETPFFNPPEHLKKVPFYLWPKEYFQDKEVDLAFDKMSEEFDKALIIEIEREFQVKVNENAFYQEGFIVSEKEKEQGIVMRYVAVDK